MTGPDLPSVLVVDDDPTIRKLLLAVLQRDGRFGTVETAEGGYQALELAYQLQPAVIVLDMAMWELSGFEALPQLKGRQPDVKIVCYTATYDERMRTEAIARGADAFVSKDTPAVELPNRIAEVLRVR